MLFFCTILLYMVVVVKYPTNMHADNIGAIFLSDNRSVSQQTKHMDVNNHFVQDYVEYRTFKIQFVHSEVNLADTFTKSLSNGPFLSLISRYVHCE